MRNSIRPIDDDDPDSISKIYVYVSNPKIIHICIEFIDIVETFHCSICNVTYRTLKSLCTTKVWMYFNIGSTSNIEVHPD